jgi:tryptophan halogenase
MNITIVGGGTAGLIAAIVIKKRLPDSLVTIIESSKVGIIGVGEGSTEHWRMFCESCDINIDELVRETAATHKYGIYFEGWSTHTPRYFHSVSGYAVNNDHIPVYDWININGKLLTNSLANPRFIENYIPTPFEVDKDGNDISDELSVHSTVNQFHFDTFKLNSYMHEICKQREITVIDDVVTAVNTNTESGFIESVEIQTGKHTADFWIDASGFARVLMNKIDNTEWSSYSKYLLVDSASPFPTPADPSGEIRPYTRARAASAGWIWEIPTQERRGNGYVYSSKHIDEEVVIQELQEATGYTVESPRFIHYDSGYLKTQWYKNCVAIGLASSFIEPLEATSISTAIQQSRLLCTFLGSYEPWHTASPKRYNEIMDEFHENLVSMIALHYISDRRDTQFWRDAADMEKPPMLEQLLSLWKERSPSRNDPYGSNGYELFQVAHLWHVAQGQGLVDKNISSLMLGRFGLLESAKKELDSCRNSFLQPRREKKHHEIFER